MNPEQKAEERLGGGDTRKEYRQITLNRGHTEPGNLFPNNFITTGKYTVLTLVPKNLFEQFHRIANIWFLIVSILQVLPLNLSPTSSWATIAPLSLVLTVSLIKDAYLDYRRHKSDREINNRKVQIWVETETKFADTRWQDLEVGNFIKLARDEPVPVDILVLSTSELNGVCYIETANLDGESNLKIKSGLADTCSILSGGNMEAIMKNVHKLDESILKTEHPNNRLYTFEGSLKIKGHPKSTSVDSTNVILRGSTLKNTTWLIGVVIFTGSETKLMMNSKTPPHKRSNVEKRVNKYLAIVFTVLFSASVLSTVISIIYAYSNTVSAAQYDSKAKTDSYLNFFTFMILFNGLVPISLYVTIDMVRVIQTRFIQWDERMYYEEEDRPAIAKTGDLNEDLGQIEFVFSDKTGTLTENQMQFRRCSVNGVKYGFVDPATPNEAPSSINTHEKFTFRDPNLIRVLQENPGESGLGDFVELMSLCHTVIPEQDDSGHLRFQASSPDEEALVIAAHCFGYTFDNVRAGFCTAVINGVKKEFKIVGVNEFSSARKRMSIVLQPITDYNRPAVLYCKGADNVMFELTNTTEDQREMLIDHLREFAVDGLRTLLCAKKELTPEEVGDFEVKWTNAKNAMSDRTSRLQEVAAEYEVDMDIVGISAIEDKIQDGAPDTIDALLRAGIKVWVLTGDKQETAINIGYGCKLLNTGLQVLQVNVKGVEEARELLRNLLEEYVFKANDVENQSRMIGRATSPHNTPTLDPFNRGGVTKHAHPLLNHTVELDRNQIVDVDHIHISLVIDGPSLSVIMEDGKCLKYFSMLSFLCHSVVCCRVSPMQKSEMVKLVKNGFQFQPMTLAIGDGANDVSMIQEAHVGIGISGKEGLQAVNSSDYAIARFRYLLPLLFIHGRWNYQRITSVILYSFYKNFLLILPMFYYSFINQYSGTALYDSYLIMSYNVILTSIPIVVLGVMDKDLPGEVVLANPSLYTSGIMAKLFNAKIFIRWVIQAISQSLLIFGLIVMLSGNFKDSSGKTEDLMLTGTVAFYAVVQTSSYVVCQEMKDWTWLFLIVVGVSYLLFYPLLFIYDAVGLPVPTMVGVSYRVFSYPTMFFAMVLTPLACLTIHLVVYFAKGLWWPNELAAFQQQDIRVHPEKEYSSLQDSIMHFRPKQFAGHLSRIFRAKGLKREVVEDKDDYSMSPLTLEFNNSHLEKAFKRFIVERSIKFVRIIFWLFFFFIVIWSIYNLTTSYTAMNLALRMIVIGVLFVVVLFTRLHWFQTHYELCVLTILGVGVFILLINSIISSSDGSMSTALIPILAFILFNLSTYKVFIIVGLAIVAYLLRAAIYYSTQMDSISLSIIVFDYSSLLIGNFLVSAYVGYIIEKERRLEFILRKRMESEFQKGQDILGNLLPKFVKDRVKQGIRYIAEDQGIVTIMFCDIYGFDKITATHTPKELTDLLDGFFAVCDQLCEKHGVTKIETVNKTYLVCGGLKDSEEHISAELLEHSHAERALSMALDILKRLELVSLRSGEKFKVKIGINSGPILAGLVGEHKPQFSLIGDTINTASRMCSTLKMPDCIQISSSTYEFVKHMDVVFETSQAEAKGKGLLTTYLVSARPSNAGRKRATIAPSRKTVSSLSHEQQQPVPVVDLNESQLPLIAKRRDSKTQKSNTISKSTTLKNTFDEGRKVGHEEEEELGLAGPVQWITCAIVETPERREYRISSAERDMKIMKSGAWMTFGIFTCVHVVFICAYIATGGTHGSALIVVFRLLSLLGNFGHAVLLKQVYTHFAFPWVIVMLLYFSSLISTLTLYTVDIEFVYAIVLEVMYCLLVVNHICGLPFGYILIAGLLVIVTWIVVVLNLYSLSDSIQPTFFIIIFAVINMAASFMRELQDRKTYNLNKLADREIQNTEKLLNQMMPAHVVRNLKNGIAPTDQYKNVTILYADIVGFTSWSSSRKPIEVVTMLSKLFTTFDHLCVKNHVYKVHTIGDCYVILGFADTGEGAERNIGEECTNMINMAFDMLKAIKKVNRVKKMSLNMRIGLHTGTLIAGITGTNIVRYDIYGADNDIANKMESGGAAGRINVSEDTMRLIEEKNPGRFEFTLNKVVTHEPTSRSVPCYFVSPVNSEELIS